MSVVKHRILIAEDAPDVARTIQFGLERAGYATVMARDGWEAQNFLEEEQFDLVILDYRMPRVSGQEVCTWMRQQPAYEQTPVILVTAKAFEFDAEELQQTCRPAAVFTKPFSPSALVEQVHLLLGGAGAGEGAEA